jgi:hypothetical protein
MNRISDSLPTQLKSKAPAAVDSQPGQQGVLVIIDSYQSSSAHGYLVEGAALSGGSTTPTPVRRVHQHQMINDRPSLPHVVAANTLKQTLTANSLTAEASREALDSFVDQAAGGNLTWANTLLKAVTAEGYTNSVVNYSQGMDAITLLQLAKFPLGASSKSSESEKANYLQNLAQATSTVGLTEKDLDNQLLQTIKNRLQKSPVVEQATQNWRQGVNEFEAGHNSVVVAAGNSGQAIKGLKAAGFEINGSEDLNIFAVPEVTVVGATIESPKGVALAGPSSFGPEVDFIADGQFGEHFGTSFACPKVANAIRAAHVANPELTSDQAEQWAKTELGQTAQVGDHTVAILDQGRVSSLLRMLDRTAPPSSP